MTKGEELRRNANNCVYLADQARDEVSQRRYRRMEEAWLVLAELQETPCSKEASALAAFGEGWIVHAAPFHASMRVKALFDDVPGLPP